MKFRKKIPFSIHYSFISIRNEVKCHRIRSACIFDANLNSSCTKSIYRSSWLFLIYPGFSLLRADCVSRAQHHITTSGMMVCVVCMCGKTSLDELPLLGRRCKARHRAYCDEGGQLIENCSRTFTSCSNIDHIFRFRYEVHCRWEARYTECLYTDQISTLLWSEKEQRLTEHSETLLENRYLRGVMGKIDTYK